MVLHSVSVSLRKICISSSDLYKDQKSVLANKNGASLVTNSSDTHLVRGALSQDVLELSGKLYSSALLLSAGLSHAHYRSPRNCRTEQHGFSP